MIAVMLSSSPSHSANGSQVVESSNMTAHPLAIIVGTVLALVQTIVCVETCEETRRIATSSHSDLSGGESE